MSVTAGRTDGRTDEWPKRLKMMFEQPSAETKTCSSMPSAIGLYVYLESNQIKSNLFACAYGIVTVFFQSSLRPIAYYTA